MNPTHKTLIKYIDITVKKAVDTAVEKAVNKTVDRAVKKAVDATVDRAVDKAVKKYSHETKQHMTDLKTFFSIEFDKVFEVIHGRPTEGRVREIVQEEITPLKQDVDIMKGEISYINKKITSKK